MKLIVSTCGIVLDLDSVPRNPHQVCPVCREPLEEAAVHVAYHPADNPTNPNDERREQSKQQALADVKAITGGAVDLGEIVGARTAMDSLHSRVSSLESRVGQTEALITAAKPD